MKLILVGCGRTKLTRPARARDLYTGCLFRARMAYAESSGQRWGIISAKHGLILPEAEIEPYDTTMANLRGTARAQWAREILRRVTECFGALCNIEIHAGAAYTLPLYEQNWPHDTRLHHITWPVEGLSQGYQLRFYSRQRAQAQLKDTA